MKTRQTIIINRNELTKILGKHFKIKPSKIDYCGWTGMLDFGEFRIEYED